MVLIHFQCDDTCHYPTNKYFDYNQSEPLCPTVNTLKNFIRCLDLFAKICTKFRRNNVFLLTSCPFQIGTHVQFFVVWASRKEPQYICINFPIKCIRYACCIHFGHHLLFFQLFYHKLLQFISLKNSKFGTITTSRSNISQLSWNLIIHGIAAKVWYNSLLLL